MPQTCGVVSRADRGGPGIAWSPEIVIAIRLLLKRDAGTSYAVVPANAGTHNHRRSLLPASRRRVPLTTTAAAYGSPRSQGRRGGGCCDVGAGNRDCHCVYSWNEMPAVGYAVVPAECAVAHGAGTHNHRGLLLHNAVDQRPSKTAAAAYGSLRSQ